MSEGIKIDNGGSAFPSDIAQLLIPTDLPEEWKLKISQITGKSNGMTLRQWYVGQALSGIIANLINTDKTFDGNLIAIAKTAFVIADALIAEDKKNK